MRRALFLLLVLVVALSACGGEGGGNAVAKRDATASLWITRDGGAHVVLTTEVPAGVSVMQALQRAANVETRYGGRFVEAINGIEGSLSKRRDWFYFVNGIEPDVGAAEVTLRPGDVAWWDHRSWERSMQEPVVVGAFPEPFRHGWAGRRRPVEVRFPPELGREARALERVLGGDAGDGTPNVFVLEVREGGEGATLTAKRGPANDAPVTFTLAGSPGAVRAAASALAHDPAVVRFHYEARFDERGRVLP